MPFYSLNGNIIQKTILGAAFVVLAFQCLRIMPRPVRGQSSLLVGGHRFYRALAYLAIASVWIPSLSWLHPAPVIRGLILASICLFYLLTAIRIVQILSMVEGVNGNTLCLGAAGYIHLGLTTGQFATLLEVMLPGSFTVGRLLPGEEIVERMNYFAFITMSSIGYGDVLPSSPLAEFYAVAVSVSGTLYVTLIIGLLLSRYINDKAEAMESQVRQSAADSSGRTVNSSTPERN